MSVTTGTTERDAILQLESLNFLTGVTITEIEDTLSTSSVKVPTSNAVTDAIAAGGGGTVSGTGVDNQIAVWTGTNTIEGTTGFIWDGTDLGIIPTSGNASITFGAADDMVLTWVSGSDIFTITKDGAAGVGEYLLLLSIGTSYFGTISNDTYAYYAYINTNSNATYGNILFYVGTKQIALFRSEATGTTIKIGYPSEEHMYIDSISGAIYFKNLIAVNMTITDSGIQLATGSVVNAILNEDDMASDLDTVLATQQSIKAYVDAATAGVGVGDVTAGTQSEDQVAVWDSTAKQIGGTSGLTFNSTTNILTTVNLTLTSNLRFNTGQQVTSIGTSITDSDSILPTAGAVYDKLNITNNYIVTGTGTGIQGESNLQFDGTTLDITGDLVTSSTIEAGSIPNMATTAALFLVSNSGEINYRTKTEMREDLDVAWPTIEVSIEAELDAAIITLNGYNFGDIVITADFTIAGNKSWDLTGITIRGTQKSITLNGNTITVTAGSPIFQDMTFYGKPANTSWGAGYDTQNLFISAGAQHWLFKNVGFANTVGNNSSTNPVIDITSPQDWQRMTFIDCTVSTEGIATYTGFSIDESGGTVGYLFINVEGQKIDSSLKTTSLYYVITGTVPTSKKSFYSDGTAYISAANTYTVNNEMTTKPAQASPAAGDRFLISDATTQQLKYVTYSQVGGAGGGMADPMTTVGDIIIRDSTNATDRLAVGTTGQILTTDGTDIYWGSGAGAGDVTAGTQTEDQIGVWTSTAKEIEGSAYFKFDGTTMTLGGLTSSHDYTLHIYAEDYDESFNDYRAKIILDSAAPWIELDSSTTGSNTYEQAAGISMGESGVGSAAMHLVYTGDGKAIIGMGALVNTASDLRPTYQSIQLMYTNDAVGIGKAANASYQLGVGGNLQIDTVTALSSAVASTKIATLSATGEVESVTATLLRDYIGDYWTNSSAVVLLDTGYDTLRLTSTYKLEFLDTNIFMHATSTGYLSIDAATRITLDFGTETLIYTNGQIYPTGTSLQLGTDTNPFGEIHTHEPLYIKRDAGISGPILTIEGQISTDTYININNTVQSQLWQIGQNTSDNFFIKDDTGGTTPLYIDSGSPTNSLHLKSTEVVINEDSLSTIDFRVETDTASNALFIDASTNILYTNIDTLLGSGSGANYTEFSGSTGKQSMEGNARSSFAMWHNAEAMHVDTAGGASFTTLLSSRVVAFSPPADNTTEGYILTSFVLPYNKKGYSTNEFSWWAHMVVDNATGNDIQWKVSYLILQPDDVYSAFTSFTDLLGTQTVANSTNDRLLVAGGGFFAGSNIPPGSRLVIKFSRYDNRATGLTDSYAGTAYVLGLGIRYNTDQLGGTYNTWAS